MRHGAGATQPALPGGFPNPWPCPHAPAPPLPGAQDMSRSLLAKVVKATEPELPTKQRNEKAAHLSQAISRAKSGMPTWHGASVQVRARSLAAQRSAGGAPPAAPVAAAACAH